MTDREIAEDLLAGQKYLSNYYYAPAILEAGNPEVRSAFQELHAGATGAAKSVFDYLHSKGWYQVPKADQETLAISEMQFWSDTSVTREEATEHEPRTNGLDRDPEHGGPERHGTRQRGPGRPLGRTTELDVGWRPVPVG